MAQTPQQRRANEAYARAEAAKRGKPVGEVSKKQKRDEKSPISRTWIYFMLFVLCGGVLVELLRIASTYFS